jgi:hypothetical protein
MPASCWDIECDSLAVVLQFVTRAITVNRRASFSVVGDVTKM